MPPKKYFTEKEKRAAQAERMRTRRADIPDTERPQAQATNRQRVQEQRANAPVQERTRLQVANANRMRAQRESASEQEHARLQVADANRKRQERQNASEQELARLQVAEANRKRTQRQNASEQLRARLQVADANRKRVQRQNATEEETNRLRDLAADRVRSQRANAAANRLTNKKARGKLEDITETDIQQYSIGEMTSKCKNCSAKHFLNEKNSKNNFKSCCHSGHVKLDPLPVSPLIQSLMTGNDERSKNFMKYIRQYNSALAFASMGAQIEPPQGHGPYCFRIHGQVYHRGSNLHPPNGTQRKYAQLYILDTELANEQRMGILENVGCLPDLMAQLAQHIEDSNNPLVAAYKMMYMLEKQEEEEALRDGREISPVEMRIYNERHDDLRRYNIPTSNEIAIVFKTADGAPPYDRDIRVYSRSTNSTIPVSILHKMLDPMTYPILFPYGTPGWTTKTKGNRKTIRNNITQLQHYAYRMAIRDEFNPIWNAGKLTQQFCVDTYAKIEANRLKYIEDNQSDLRQEDYTVLNDYIKNKADNEGVIPGKAVILPSTFQGSPRNMQQNYQDAMAIVTKHGKPDLFITMTCNPKWPEITENLNGSSVEFRPDLVARVFNLKLKELLDDIIKKQILGKIIARVHVVEFQKRGLPHAHILLILASEDKLRTEEDIDQVVSAEIPDPSIHPRLHAIVMQNMIHGPCGNANPNSPCMSQGKCTKDFPKQECADTLSNVNGYPIYRRRRLTPDKIGKYRVGVHAINNTWVVPYNPYLLLKYNCHINVEVCASVKSVKYLFKYVYKGHDCANIELKEKYSTSENGSLNWNELKSHVNARYVSAPEAVWRIFEYKMHDQSHAIIRLAIHLPNQRNVYFQKGKEDEALARPDGEDTLTAWFRLNQTNADARKLLYTEIPTQFVFHPDGKEWKPRKKTPKPPIGRMYYIAVQQGELYYLRLLLLHVKGATSYEDLRTVDGELCPTFKDAAIKMGLFEDDNEWEACLTDAETHKMPVQLRELFAYICVYGCPRNALELWENHKEELSEDIVNAHGISNELAEQYALREIEQVLFANRKTLNDFGLPGVQADLPELCLNPTEVGTDGGNRLPSNLNPAQKAAFDDIMRAVQNEHHHDRYFFLDGPGGSGKTFTYETLYHNLTGVNLHVTSVASTGIAATLLPFGRTAHSRFGFPVPFNETSTSSIRGTSEAAKLLRKTKLIVWDEVTMSPHFQLKEVDRLLRELMNNNRPFGGKVMVLGGDFRQCLPVVKNGGRVATVEQCIKNGRFWPLFKQLKLSVNMRLNSPDPEHDKWLIKLGNGELLNSDELAEDVVEVPSECVETGNLIDSIFGEKLSPDKTSEFAYRAILSPKNDNVREINEEVLNRLDGDEKIYLSADSLGGEDSEAAEHFPIDFLNSIASGGMPMHRCKLKLGAIVMLLRNLNPVKGLCNGTRLIVRAMMPNVIMAEILTGNYKGSLVFVPRICLSTQKGDYPFILHRRQFPVTLAFAMTINKSQGQSFDKVGIDLQEPVFSHGQLYVAFSRGRSKSGIKIKVKEIPDVQGRLLPESAKVFTRNCVYKEVFEYASRSEEPMQCNNSRSQQTNAFHEQVQVIDFAEAIELMEFEQMDWEPIEIVQPDCQPSTSSGSRIRYPPPPRPIDDSDSD